MGLIPDDVINQVIDRSDIATVVGSYTALKKTGRNFKALCPFHNEKTPSFVVNPDKQIFHCFGCGVGGNVIGFIMRQERIDFPEAVRFLAHKAGVVVPETEADRSGPSRQVREEIFTVNALAAGFFHETLLISREADAKAARDYLKARGVDLETVRKFQLGFAPDQWDALLKYGKAKGFNEELMLKAGLITSRESGKGCYDRFRNRVMFPIFDLQDRTVAFGGRAMTDEAGAKYINSPETPVYTKGRHMFGLSLTKTAVGNLDCMIVVEGYMDMMIPYTHGVGNIAASLGTALTVDQIRLVRRYTPNVVMLFDTDPAGQSAIVRSLDVLIDEGMNVRVAVLDEGEDPDSFMRKHGPEAFGKRLAASQSLLDFKFNWLCNQCDLNSVDGKSKISRELLSTIARFKNEVTQYELTKQLAVKLNVPQGVLLKEAGKSPGLSRPSLAPVVGRVVQGSRTVEDLLLALFLKDPAWVRAAQETLSPEDFSEGPMRSVVRELWPLAAGLQEWSVQEVVQRLDEDGQNLVTRLVNQDEGKLGDSTRIFQDCVGCMQKERLKKTRVRLMEKIRQAERSGDDSQLDQLKEEFNEIMKL